MSGSGGASRRAVLLAAGAAGAASVLAACGDGAGTSPQPESVTAPGDPSGGSAPGVSIPVANVPVGGGYIDFTGGVIVTQPEAGQFRAFDANCTHMRCLITWVEDGVIRCPCHGSEFRVADGSVIQGPATRSLDTRTFVVDGNAIVVS